MPAQPYKISHDRLIAAIGTADKYDGDWRTIATGLGHLVTATGFDPKYEGAAGSIRVKVALGRGESATLRAGAHAPATASGADAIAGNKRALALKTVRHLYLYQTFGRQKVWILSLPKALPAFPIDYGAAPATTVDAVLDSHGEKFDATMMKDLSEACQNGLAWVQKAMIAAGAPMTFENRKLFRRWFIPAGTPGEDAKIAACAAKLTTGLLKIASGLKSGEVILTDSPQERGKGSSLEKSEAFVFTAGDLITVYIEGDFFSAKNTLTGKTNWARIIVHELSHAYVKTKDHAYSWQGLLPRTDDAFKSVEDKYIVRSPGFPAVRALTLDQCIDNADSWAFFCADAAGALSESDRMRALGTRLYDIGGETVDKGTAARLKTKAT